MKMNFKIICTGNPASRGLPPEIKKLYPNATFLSRTSGYDLLNLDEEKFRKVLKNHNVFINYSLVKSGVQQKLLKIVADTWTSGHIFNIGSYNEENSILTSTEPAYTKDKLDLRRMSLELNNEKLKVTHITVGGFKSASKGSDNTMDPALIANSIKWILEQPFEVPVIGIQQSSDYIRNWIKQQGKK